MAQHHVQVLVSREKFFKNIQYLRRLVAPSKLCVVMKANAYGHGLEALAPVAVRSWRRHARHLHQSGSGDDSPASG